MMITWPKRQLAPLSLACKEDIRESEENKKQDRRQGKIERRKENERREGAMKVGKELSENVTMSE